MHGSVADRLRTLDHATARTAVVLAGSLGVRADAPRVPPAGERGRHPGTRRHIVVAVSRKQLGTWRWEEAPACDRRSFLRGALLGSGSISFGRSGSHVEFVLRSADAAETLLALLAQMDIRSLLAARRGAHVVYLKGQDQIAALLGLVGANRGVLELETQRVDRDVRARLNRLVNAEGANLGRTVHAADRQLRAIDRLERGGTLPRLTPSLREVAAQRRLMPDADLDILAGAIGISRSATNHRLRRLIELAGDAED